MRVKTVPVTRTRATRCARLGSIAIQAPRGGIIDEEEGDDDDDGDDFPFVFAIRRHEQAFVHCHATAQMGRPTATNNERMESLRCTQSRMIADTPV